MKGFYIYEAESRIGTEVDCLKIGYIDHTFTHQIDSGTLSEEVEMHALVSKGTKTKCSPDDTYDFEVGALISLMKMCGLEKSAKAYAEIFDDTAYGDALIERDKLKEENKNLKDEVGLKNNAINEWKQTLRERTEKIGDLVCENYKLKTDCEKLQHGYIDNETIFCGGRQNGKQFTFLVDLFKKLDQKKVDAAYKEAYNTTLPVWQKEVLNQMYGVYKESKEKPELPRTLDINGTVYRKSIQIKDFGEQINKLTVDSLIEQSRAFTKKCVDEWLNKPLTKREEMWGKILGDYKIGEGISIKVEKAFINDFLSEAEENGLVWANGGEKPTEWDRWESWRRHDYIVFSLLSVVNPKELTWNITLKENTINYLPPMRWDLFKKGRLAVKVNYNNYKEFYEVCEKVLGKRPVTAFMDDFTVSICKKDGNFEIFTVEDQKKTGRKIVSWEDVR